MKSQNKAIKKREIDWYEVLELSLLFLVVGIIAVMCGIMALEVFVPSVFAGSYLITCDNGFSTVVTNVGFSNVSITGTEIETQARIIVSAVSCRAQELAS